MGEQDARSTSVDVLIVGSGPIGATFARVLCEQAPWAKILMVDLGPQLTERAGMNIRNLASEAERATAAIRSQGPKNEQYAIPTVAERSAATVQSPERRAALLARPGTHLINPDDPAPLASAMPAAALSSNVGGMGAHWTCACPDPGYAERIPFIEAEEWKRLRAKAEALLSVTRQAYPMSVEGIAIQRALGAAFDDRLPGERKVQPMPLACRVEPGGKRYWVGADVVLGPLAEPAYQRVGRFELRAETLCRQLFTADRRVTGALIEHLPSGTREVVEAKVVIVAADTLRTPQLLWASGIRPRALGHYLNDQPQVLCAVSLHEHLIAQTRASLTAEQQLDPSARVLDDTTVGVFWVPFHDPTHPFHGQVMHLDVSPIPLNVSEVRADPRHVVGLGWFCRKELRYEDHVAFTDEQRDYLGMPRMQIHYALTPADEEAIAGAKQEVARAASALGEPILGDEPHLIPAGSSLHYQGTVRLGESDDGQSVCDPYSRVWGFSNLFVGGNGVIPTATACNPTLTSVALAVRACDRIAALLS